MGNPQMSDSNARRFRHSPRDDPIRFHPVFVDAARVPTSCRSFAIRQIELSTHGLGCERFFGHSVPKFTAADKLWLV
jgi:hypothetical protein